MVKHFILYSTYRIHASHSEILLLAGSLLTYAIELHCEIRKATSSAAANSIKTENKKS